MHQLLDIVKCILYFWLGFFMDFDWITATILRSMWLRYVLLHVRCDTLYNASLETRLKALLVRWIEYRILYSWFFKFRECSDFQFFHDFIFTNGLSWSLTLTNPKCLSSETLLIYCMNTGTICIASNRTFIGELQTFWYTW